MPRMEVVATAVAFGMFCSVFVFFSWLGGLISSRRGWGELAFHWRSITSPSGTNLPWISGWVGTQNHRNTLNVRFNDSGVWIAAIFIYSWYHPTLFFPWSSIADVEDTTVLLFQSVEIYLEESDIRLSISGFGARTIFEGFNRYRRTRRQASRSISPVSLKTSPSRLE
jgi:hypothetical protein